MYSHIRFELAQRFSKVEVFCYHKYLKGFMMNLPLMCKRIMKKVNQCLWILSYFLLLIIIRVVLKCKTICYVLLYIDANTTSQF